MNNFEKIKNMTLDEMAQRFAVNYLAGWFTILRKAEIPEDIIKDFGRRNLVNIICEYKKILQQEVSE
jgi:hypothetical protein